MANHLVPRMDADDNSRIARPLGRFGQSYRLNERQFAIYKRYMRFSAGILAVYAIFAIVYHVPLAVSLSICGVAYLGQLAIATRGTALGRSVAAKPYEIFPKSYYTANRITGVVACIFMFIFLFFAFLGAARLSQMWPLLLLTVVAFVILVSRSIRGH
jgi:hypothetical protein